MDISSPFNDVKIPGVPVKALYFIFKHISMTPKILMAASDTSGGYLCRIQLARGAKCGVNSASAGTALSQFNYSIELSATSAMFHPAPCADSPA